MRHNIDHSTKYVFDMDSSIEADRPIIAQGGKLFLHHIDLESHQQGMKMARCINFFAQEFYCAQQACEVLKSSGGTPRQQVAHC